MKQPEDVNKWVLEKLDELVRDMSQEDYLETLEILESDISMRIETVKQEIEQEK